MHNRAEQKIHPVQYTSHSPVQVVCCCMGQVNTTVEGEQVNGESPKAEKLGEKKDLPKGREKEKETVNCVKDKIDLLIEGCLLAKDFDSNVNPNVSSDERKTVQNSEILQQLEQERYELVGEAVEATPNAINGADEIKREAKETSRDSAKFEKVKKDIGEGTDGKNKGDRDSGKEEQQRPILSARDLLEDDKRYRELHVGYPSGVIPTTIKIKSSPFSHVQNEQSKIMPHSDGRTKITTFQTFIDNVLDSSLKNKSLSSTEQSSHKSSLQESTSGIQSSTKNTNLKNQGSSDSNKKLISEAGLKIKQEDKWKDSKASMDMTQAQVLCLKDHIERVLEKSFNADFHSPNKDQKNSRQEQEKRNSDRKVEHSSMAGKLPIKISPDKATYNDQDGVCGPEGFVNSVLNQSMKNNRLLSPPKTSHNETNQSVKINQNTPSRANRDYHEPQNSDILSVHHNVAKEECFQFQLSSYQDGEHVIPQQKSPGNGQVSSTQRMEHIGYYPSSMLPHGSASPKGYPHHSRLDFRDSRQEYHYAHTLPTSAGFFSLDKNPSTQPSGIYPQDKNPSAQSSGIYSHVSLERSPGSSSSAQLRNQFSQSSPSPGVNDNAQFSPIGMFYPPSHTAIGQYSQAQPIGDRVSSNNGYTTSSQEIHLRDCRCPSCISKSSASKSAQNTPISDQRKLETQIPQGQ
ncbi:hypothetical protein CHS0354_015319 [Potamilus streckersoni]|uniref:Uncharacterized protein n=1 Tax=Potamilus streckersoni TaxID=2493646 RepID=A0AAE0W7N9_9BIVA|nr:hypothetical protein CHS0354_015319 [Potamilus streckersoni]